MSDADPSTPEGPRPQPMGPVAVALTVLTAALWGGTSTATKYATDVLPPIAVSGIRFGIAAVFMLVWCLAERSEIRLRRGQFLPSLFAGLLLYAQIGLFTIAIHLSNASHGTVLINTFIFGVLALDHFVTRDDRLSGRTLTGLVVAAAGVGLIFLFGRVETPDHGDPSSLLGDLVMVASAVVLAVKVVYTRHATRFVEPTKLILWHDVIGFTCFAVTSACLETVTWSRVDTPALIALAYQGLAVGGFCFGVQAVLLKHHSATQISIFSFATPLFGTAIAVYFRGDVLSPWLLVGGLCVAAGIFLVTARR